MTSAPRSPSSWPQNGPANTREASSTRTSDRGPNLERVMMKLRKPAARSKGEREPSARPCFARRACGYLALAAQVALPALDARRDLLRRQLAPIQVADFLQDWIVRVGEQAR